METTINIDAKRVKIEGVSRREAVELFRAMKQESLQEHSHPGVRISYGHDDYHDASIMWIGYNEHNYETFTPMDYILAYVHYFYTPKDNHLMVDWDYYFYLIIQEADAEEELTYPEGRRFLKKLRKAHLNSKEV